MNITASLWRDMVISASNNLFNNKQSINDLNVFPVPDGDTGTNMYLTSSSAKTQISGMETDSLDEVASAVSNAMIRGARGNSGVILSLLFRGISKGFKGLKEATPSDFAKALSMGVDSAYKAVMKPTEGTILTVSKYSSVAGLKSAENGKDLLEILEDMISEAKNTLNKTPDMLPVLKQANVVDAGGKGFVVVLEAMYSVARDGIIIQQDDSPKETAPAESENKKLPEKESHYTYSLSFIVDKYSLNSNSDNFREYSESIGDNDVFDDKGDIIQFECHTDNPGKIIEAAIKIGSLKKITVVNKNEAIGNVSSSAPKEENTKPVIAKAEKKYGFVAVAPGKGIASVFTDLGVDNIIEGGQTMNPSTENILNAINATPSDIVFVFPNNKNIIMAAQQCIGLTSKRVKVIPTKTAPQGITAMLSFDPDSDTKTNEKAMNESCSNVKTLSVTYAARDSVFDGLEIKQGQFIGMIDGKVSNVNTDLNDCLKSIIKEVKTGNEEFINIYYGADTSESDAESVNTLLSEEFPGSEITVIDGGQPVYYYIISIE